MGEKVTRKEQAINTKKKLIQTSLNLFRTKGFDEVTINEICKKANVTTGAFYHHIKSKYGVIVEAYSEYDSYCDDKIKDIDASKSCMEKLYEYLKYQIDYTQDMGLETISVIYKIQITEDNKFFLSEKRTLYKHLNNIIKLAQENNELVSDVSSENITSELLLIIRGVVYNWCQCLGEYNLLEMENRIVGNYMKAYQIK